MQPRMALWLISYTAPVVLTIQFSELHGNVTTDHVRIIVTKNLAVKIRNY